MVREREIGSWEPGVLRRVSTLVLASVLLVLTPATGAAQEEPTGELRESQQRLEQIRQERSGLREELSLLRSRVHDLSSELSNLERQRSTSSELIEELEFQAERTGDEIELIADELRGTRARLVRQRAALRQRLRQIYKRGPMHTVQALLSADSFSDLLNRYKYLYLVAQRDRNLVAGIDEMERHLSSREQLLQRQQERVEALLQERLQELDGLASLEQERSRTLSSVQRREEGAAERVQQLEEDERRVSALIETLERSRREARAGRADGPATVGPGDRGALPWPVTGGLLYRFGRQVQSGGTAVRWNGVGITADEGTSVQAVAPGNVVHAGPFERYGPSVFLSHGGGYYSLYLYLGELHVAEGGGVARGQSVGTVGGRGRGEAPHIEFQIRVPGGQAEDPELWLVSPAG